MISLTREQCKNVLYQQLFDALNMHNVVSLLKKYIETEDDIYRDEVNFILFRIFNKR